MSAPTHGSDDPHPPSGCPGSAELQPGRSFVTISSGLCRLLSWWSSFIAKATTQGGPIHWVRSPEDCCSTPSVIDCWRSSPRRPISPNNVMSRGAMSGKPGAGDVTRLNCLTQGVLQSLALGRADARRYDWHWDRGDHRKRHVSHDQRLRIGLFHCPSLRRSL